VPKWQCNILLHDERWNEYAIEDGSRIVRMIFVAQKALKLLNAYDKFGQPVYRIEGKPLIRVISARMRPVARENART
jgi:hypothetical protein